MSNEFKWTLESTIDFFEFAYERPHESFSNNLAAFVASKEPKKEWEIVDFRVHKDSKLLYTLREDGRYRADGHQQRDGFSLDKMLQESEIIHSVRRLSDGLLFSIGEKFLTGAGRISVITSFVINRGKMEVHFEIGSNDLQHIKKLPAPLFTTLDGKDIISGDVFWVVNKETQLSERLAGISSPNYIFDGDKVFSTREAAETYIVNNKPCLSVEDVKEILERSGATNLLSKLSGLVKSKL